MWEALVKMPLLPPPSTATTVDVGDNAKDPRLANARPSEKGGIAAKVAAKLNVCAPPVEQN